MAAYMLAPARTLAAFKKGPKVSHLNLSCGFFQTPSASIVYQIKPFSCEHFFRQPPAAYTVRPYFRRCTPRQNGKIFGDGEVTLQHSSRRRRLSGLSCTSQSSTSSANISFASQFTSSSSLPAPPVAESTSFAEAAFCPAVATSSTIFKPALRFAAPASASNVLMVGACATCEALAADRGSRVAGTLRGTTIFEACLLRLPYFSSLNASAALPYFSSPYISTTARASHSTRRKYATLNGRNINTDNTSSDEGQRHSSTNDSSSSGSATCREHSKNNKVSKSTTWLEVERMRPRAPNPWDGTYQWPATAPDPLEIKRESFHAFMHGKQELFSRELKVFVYGWAMAALFIGLMALTIYVMAPDDFEWVEEERARMERAKRKKAAAEPIPFSISDIDNTEEPGDTSESAQKRKKA